MEKLKKVAKKHDKKLRFAIVGLFNTGLDFFILLTLTSLGLAKIPSNYISTGIAFLSSFFLNKKYTFRNSTTDNIHRQFVLFIAVTMFGLWFIQPVVIVVLDWLISGFINSPPFSLVVEKLLATIASMLWNYIMYARYVFKR